MPADCIARFPEVRHHGDSTEVIFPRGGAAGEGTFFVRINRAVEIPEDALGAAAAAFHFWPSLKLGARLVVEAPVAAGMLENLGVLAEIYHGWYPETFGEGIAVQAPVAGVPGAPSAGQSVFFSGGVDSTFSAMRRRGEIDHLIFAVGFDIDAGNHALARAVGERLRESAAWLGRPLLEVHTDVRAFSDAHVHWGSHYCGAAMAGVGHLLSSLHGRVRVPATMTWSHLAPFGTHPMTDERWSSPRVAFHHDGAEVRRIGKMRALAAEAGALRHLRVCWRNPDNAYNCGRCEKCVRAMANLRALGMLGQCPSFPSVLDLDQVRDLEIDHPLVVAFVEETIAEAEANGDGELAAAARASVTRYLLQRLGKSPKALLERLPDSDIWKQKTFGRFRDAVVAACYKADPAWTQNKLLHALPPEERLRLARESKKRWWRMGR